MNLLKLLLATGLMLLCGVVMAQTVDTTGISTTTVFEKPTLTKMISSYEVLYGALLIIWGYLGKAFGWKGPGNNYIFVVLAGGVILAGVFIAVGWSDAIGLTFSFLSAIGVFDLFLKPTAKIITPLLLKSQVNKK